MILLINVMLIIALGIWTSYTDIRDGKIYNKHLLTFLAAIVAVDLATFFFDKEIIAAENWEKVFLNAGIALLLSFAMFISKIWTAGDSKLFSVYILIIPLQFYREQYSTFFLGFSLLMNIFALALIYIAFDTLYHLISQRRASVIEKVSISKYVIKDIISRSIFVVFFSVFFRYLLNNTMQEFYLNNAALFQVMHFIAILLILKNFDNIKFYFVIALVELFVLITMHLLWKPVFVIGTAALNYKVMLLLLFLITLRHFSVRFDYKIINVSALQPGMTLSLPSLLLLNSSRIKDLPKYHDTRLTEIEVEAIKKWSKSSKGQSELTIIRKVPFAPLIFLGVIIQLVFRGYIFN